METHWRLLDRNIAMADPLKAEYTPILKWPAETRPQEANAEFAAWKLWVGVNCTWLYIGSQDAWAVFIIYLFFRSSFPFTPTDVTSIACLFKIVLINVVLYSKYGSVRLGPEGSTPEYNDASWYFLF